MNVANLDEYINKFFGWLKKIKKRNYTKNFKNNFKSAKN